MMHRTICRLYRIHACTERRASIISISQRYKKNANTPPSCIRSRRCENATTLNNRYKSSGTSPPVEDAALVKETVVISPTASQLGMHALRCAVPMIGFGFMDNTIMIHAGHYVDCTLGVTFGLSTLAAAGIGQIFSGIGGVVFGDALDTAFRKISGSTTMTSAQRAMRTSRIVGTIGGVIGVGIGCVLGLVNLLFVDEQKASLLKLQALEDGQEFEFEVEVDNERHAGYTTVIVRGPDVDGVLASITASLAAAGCSVVELHAENRVQKKEENESILEQLVQQSQASQAKTNNLEDVFIIRDRSTHLAIDDEDLEDLARTVLAAAKDPLNSYSLKTQVADLQMENDALADRVQMLEGRLEDEQIKVKTSRKQGGKKESERS